jgi:hypothetical protein
VGHAEHDGQLFVRVAWEDSWQPAADLVGEALDAYQASLAAAGGTTDVAGRAQQELAAQQQAEQRQQAEQQRHSRSRSRAAAAAAPAATA